MVDVRSLELFESQLRPQLCQCPKFEGKYIDMYLDMRFSFSKGH